MSIRKRIKPIESYITNKTIVNNHQTNKGDNLNIINKENIDNNNSIDLNNKRKGPFEESVPKRQMLSDMLNGYRTDQRSGGDRSDHHQESPVSTLSNMGNTCWLNSVLYTLRFAPTFLHNLHHLIGDLQLTNSRLNQNKIKTSSLGRNIGTITSSSSSSSARSTSSKDLLSLTTNFDVIKSKYQIVTEKLHELYCIMHQIEMKESNEPYQPDALLQAIRDANAIFEGNHQQDAHELLVYLLDNLRETCDLLQQHIQCNPNVLNNDIETVNTTNSNNSSSKLWGVSRSKKKIPKKKDKNIKDCVINEESQQKNLTNDDDTCSVDSNNSENQQRNNNKRLIYNFIVDDFQGITLRRTRCLECESITERKEPFYDIPVPIPLHDDDCDLDFLMNNSSEIFRKACVLSEKLCDTNKYLCEQCSHYNEAVRDVLFERLPNIMVLQLKRFTTTTNGIQKVNTFLPTPLELECFCETCHKFTTNKQTPQHYYQLYCVIMHLGGTMASGHYISYIKASDHLNGYMDCSRNIPKNLTLSSSSSEKSLNFLKYFKPKQLTNTLIDSSKNLVSSSSSSSTKNVSNGVRLCKSIDCCGIKLNRNVIENTINSFNRTANNSSANTIRNDIWLECDDENVRPITTQEFQDELSYKPNSTSTPYLLFYTKTTENLQ